MMCENNQKQKQVDSLSEAVKETQQKIDQQEFPCSVGSLPLSHEELLLMQKKRLDEEVRTLKGMEDRCAPDTLPM